MNIGEIRYKGVRNETCSIVDWVWGAIMGMYTELVFAAKIKLDIPTVVVGTLKHMVDHNEPQPTPLPDHHLFRGDNRWRLLFRCSSYYFDGQPHAEFKYDDIASAYFLTTRANLKNYGNEIELFLDWMKPYLDDHTGPFLGYKQYETDESPTLIYWVNGQIVLDRVTPPKELECSK